MQMSHFQIQRGGNVFWNKEPSPAFFIDKQPLQGYFPSLISYDTPLWHPSVVRNDKNLSPQAIILTTGQFLEVDPCLLLLPKHGTQLHIPIHELGFTVYHRAQQLLLQTQAEFGSPSLLPRTSFWIQWTKHDNAFYLSHCVKCRVKCLADFSIV